MWVDVEGSLLMLYDGRTNNMAAVVNGDRVHLTGFCEPGTQSKTTNPNLHTLEVLAHGTLPPVSPVSVTDLITSPFTNTRVSVRGIIRDTADDDIDPRVLYVLLSDGSNTVALTHFGSVKDVTPVFRSLLDAEVVAEGVCVPTSGPRPYHYRLIHISGPESIHVVRNARHDRFDAPEFDFGTKAAPDKISTKGRRKIVGTVSARWNGDTILVRTADAAVVAELADLPPPSVGTCVEIVGNPETDLFDISLTRAFWRESPLPPLPEPSPEPRSIRSIFLNARGLPENCAAAHGRLLRISGSVANILLDENENRSILLSEGEYNMLVRCEAIPEVFESVRKGCRIEATGICVKDSDVWRPSVPFPHVRGLFLVPRTAADIRILSHPPWWTPMRFAVCLAILLGILVLALVWNASLRILVIRKSKALLREQAERLVETLKTDERTRLAADLHDYHSQNLTAIAYQVARARRFWKEQRNETGAVLEAVARMLKSCRTDLRNCLWDLRSDTLDEPDFAKAIRRTTTTVVGTARLAVRFEGSRARMSDPTAHAVLSILRELVANAVNHGHADEIHIAGECRPGLLRFSVRDNGHGFDPEACPSTSDGHFGLGNVRERLRRLGGSLDIDSHPGGGTYVRLTIIHHAGKAKS